MKKSSLKILLLLTLLIIIKSVPPIFTSSDKYIKTGVFEITSSPFLSATTTNGYSVVLTGCAVSSSVYKVGFGLHTLDIKFYLMKILFDIQVMTTSMTGFDLSFSTTMGNFISMLKVCYMIKNPSYTDLFYIQDYRYTGPSFLITSVSPFIQSLTLATPLPASSLGSINDRTLLYCFNFQSTDPGIQNNIDVYPSTMIIDQFTIQFRLETMFDNVKVAFFAVTIAYYDDNQVTNAGLSRFTLADVDSSTTVADLFYDSTPLKMFTYNMFVGVKAFHVRTLQTPNFLNFQTVLINDSYVQFLSTNSVNWGYMKFEMLLIQTASCPLADPYFIYYLADCQNSIPAGYAQNCEGNYVIDFQMNLQYLNKQPQKNQIQIMFNLQPSDPTSTTLMSQINWNNALNIDIPGTKTIEYINSPYPQLKITVDYVDNLESQQKNIIISTYDSTLYPINFNGFSGKTIPIKITSQNNLAVNFYDNSIYNAANSLKYVFLAISCIYMVFFLIGFIAGKVYILQMAFVPQVTYLSVVSLINISPTMSSLSYLRWVFGYWYSDPYGTTFPQQGRNYMKIMGISDNFFLNYNVMFIFIILTFVLALVFHLKKKIKARNFFLLDVGLYLALWFGLWIIFTGQIEIRALAIQQKDSALSICGLIFFLLCLFLLIGYLVIYMKRVNQIESFFSVFSHTKIQIQNDEQNRTKYFYLILFSQRMLLATLFANVFIFKYLNIILMVIHLIIITLIIVFKPYKFRFKPNKQNRRPLPIKANIRQILNYSILILILLFLFITNQIQQSQFKLYIPVIVIILLFINIILTILFLFFDNRLKEDFQAFKKLFNDDYDLQQEQKQQFQKQQFQKQQLQNIKKEPYPLPQLTQKKIRQQDIKVNFTKDFTPKDTLMYKKPDFDRSFQMSISPFKRSNQSNLNDFRLMGEDSQRRNNFNIDDQLMKVAEKNQQNYRKNVQQGRGNDYSPSQEVSKIKSYHSIMKGSTTPKKAGSYQKHNNYFGASSEES